MKKEQFNMNDPREAIKKINELLTEGYDFKDIELEYYFGDISIITLIKDNKEVIVKYRCQDFYETLRMSKTLYPEHVIMDSTPNIRMANLKIRKHGFMFLESKRFNNKPLMMFAKKK